MNDDEFSKIVKLHAKLIEANEQLHEMHRKHNQGMREHFPEMMLFFSYLSSEGERSAVVLGAERLNVAVEHLLKAYLRPCPSKKDSLFVSDGALSTFSRKIEIAYRIGLIDLQLKRALDLVRNLRNDFAHATLVEKLEQQNHADRVKQLRKMLLNDSKNEIKRFEAEYMKEGKMTKIGISYISCITWLVIKIELTCFLLEKPKHRFVAKLNDMDNLSE